MSEPKSNFADALVTVAPSPVDSGLTFTVDDATPFPSPTNQPYDVTVEPTDTRPNYQNTEIVTIASFGGNVITLKARGAQGSASRNIKIGDRVTLAITKKTMDDIDAEFNSGWIEKNLETWTFASGTNAPTYTFTVPNDQTAFYYEGTRVKLSQSQSYTNDPGAGSNIVLNMTDTSGFTVGNTVIVSSGAGSEKAIIVSIVTNTSITVDTLAINHTTVNPLVTCYKYFIVTKKSTYNAGTVLTTVTCFGGTLFKLINTTIINNGISRISNPLDFPMDPALWTVRITDNIQRNQPTPTSNSWYNINSALSISVPIGIWDLHYKALAYVQAASDLSLPIYTTLSTANNSESDGIGTVKSLQNNGEDFNITHDTRFEVKLSSKTTYFLNVKTDSTDMTTIGIQGAQIITIIEAKCLLL